jgi:histidine kinase
MSLVWKFFLSYLVVLAVGLGVLSVSTAYVAPENFSRSMAMMMGDSWTGSDMQHGMMMDDGQWTNGNTPVTNEALNASFRRAVDNALWKAGIAATLAAGVISGLVSMYIIRPLRRLAKASQHIAEGHYDQRLAARENDELGELTRSFNRMAEALAATETMRRQLIGDVSHELNTPLASIKGYMEGLQDGVIPPTPETFQLVHREADRLQRLVYDLQELSRAEAVSSQLDLRPCDPHDLVQAVDRRLLPQFADKGINLEMRHPEPAQGQGRCGSGRASADQPGRECAPIYRLGRQGDDPSCPFGFVYPVLSPGYRRRPDSRRSSKGLPAILSGGQIPRAIQRGQRIWVDHRAASGRGARRSNLGGKSWP